MAIHSVLAKSITPLSFPIKIGLVQPNSRIEAAIAEICAAEWVRALLANGINWPIWHCTTLNFVNLSMFVLVNVSFSFL